MRLPHNAPFLDATAEGRLLLQRCEACGPVPGFPRITCPRCLGELAWFESSGAGTIVSFTVVHRPDRAFAERVPIVLATIALDDGAETIASVVGDDRLEARIGDRVELARSGRWSELPQFARAGDANFTPVPHV